MQITNKYNLPKVLFDAMKKNMEGFKAPTNADANYRVTQLCSPPRLTTLRKRHAQNIDRDIYDCYHSNLLGDAIHGYLQYGLKDNDNYLTEYNMNVELFGRKLSGTLDCYDKEQKALIDHKTVSTYVYSSLEQKKEWEEQTNIYAYLLQAQGYEVEKIFIHVIFKDWKESGTRYAKQGEYPPVPVMLHEVNVLSKDKQKELVEGRLKRLLELESVEDDKLPICTAEDMWEKPSSFAVYKEGAGRATKLCPTYKDAQDYIKWKGKYGIGLKIEHRQGVRTRCERYCDAAPYCNQYQQWLKDRDNKVAEAIEANVSVGA